MVDDRTRHFRALLPKDEGQGKVPPHDLPDYEIYLWQGDDATYGTESGQKLIHAFVEAWLLYRPRPEWILIDAQTSLAKGDFAAFCQSIGIGVTAVPGEEQNQ